MNRHLSRSMTRANELDAQHPWARLCMIWAAVAPDTVFSFHIRKPTSQDSHRKPGPLVTPQPANPLVNEPQPHQIDPPLQLRSVYACQRIIGVRSVMNIKLNHTLDCEERIEPWEP